MTESVDDKIMFGVAAKVRISALVVGAAMAVGVSLASHPAAATVYTLVDQNSSATVDVGSSAGMKDWSVDGSNQLYRQWFWYRTGDMTREKSIDTLALNSASLVDSGGAPGADHLTVNYSGASVGGQTFTIQIIYSLLGSTLQSGLSSISEQITIKNTSNSALDFHFYQYSDFDLGGTPGDDYATINAFHNRVTQIDPDPLSPLNFEETVDTPKPDKWEINTVGSGGDKTPVPGDTLYRLEDSLISLLSNSASPVAGDVSWAFEWDRLISAGGTLTISKVKSLQVTTFHERTNMPEPGTLALLGMGFFGVAVLRRRRAVATRQRD